MELPSSPDFERTLKAAEGGDAQAMLRAADYYYQGDLVKRNYKKAVQWYRRAVEHGLAKAEFGLGLCFASGHGEKVDYAEAVKWYRKAADKGHTEATWKLAECYRHGTGVTKDEPEAVRLYRKAAEAGHDRAQCTLGYQIEHGQGVAKDMAEAIEWYRKAGENGNATAQLNLALCYDNGRGVTADPVMAFSWFLKAAERGNVRAQHRVGLAYETGRGVVKDITQALSWYHKAADNDSGESWNRIGRIYDYGDGVPQDQVEAIRCYKLASDFAAAAVAYAHEQGQAVGKDLSQAARWYRKGADGGDLKCLVKLAEFYEKGKGMKADAAEALKWYIKAAEKGSEEALQWLHDSRSTPAHLKEAEKAYLEKKEAAAAAVPAAAKSPPSPPLPLSKAEKKKANAAAAAVNNNSANNGTVSTRATSTVQTATPPLPPATASSQPSPQAPATKPTTSLMRTYDESVVYQLVTLLPTASQVSSNVDRPIDKAAQAMVQILLSRIETPHIPIPQLSPVKSMLAPADLQQVLAKHQEQLQAFFYGLMEDVTLQDISWPQLVERVAQRLTGLRALIDGEIGPRIRGPLEFLRLMHCSNCERLLLPPIFQCEQSHIVCGACKNSLTACAVCRSDLSKATHNPSVEKFAVSFPTPCMYQCGGVMTVGESTFHANHCHMRPFTCPENWQTANRWLGHWPGDVDVCKWSGPASDVVHHCISEHAMPLVPSEPFAVEFDVSGPPPFTDTWQWRGAAIAGRLFVCGLVRQPDGSARCFGVKASEERIDGEVYKIAFTVGPPDEVAVIGCSLPLYSTRAPAPYGVETDFEISQKTVQRLAPDGKLRALFRFSGVVVSK